ncbi:hypothetical protein ACVLD2_001865 [Paenibacillus sp. PvR052]|nr:hypothetical protein [Paenibacillus sp. PvP091]MBP1170383.1 hypothetical protein [Paenibacillus sp. PvR098]MBP2441411.1 hypothetical protein [Paenibacillus sp. PvP052]
MRFSPLASFKEDGRAFFVFIFTDKKMVETDITPKNINMNRMVYYKDIQFRKGGRYVLRIKRTGQRHANRKDKV